jgi:hypothetical protein
MTRMTQHEKQAFLAGLHVGVLAIPNPGAGPLTAPVWYGYEPGGDLWFLTGPTSRKGRLLAPGVRVSLCAQTETPPYRYVSVEGPVVSIEPAGEDDLLPMAVRYLGDTAGRGYVESTRGEVSVVVRVTLEHWLAVDYGKA